MKKQFNILLTMAALMLCAHKALAIDPVFTGSVGIPDNSPNVGASAEIDTSGVEGTVAAVNGVTFSISGGWAGDFTVVLQYTDGTVSRSAQLFSGLLGGTAANGGFDNVTLVGGSGTSLSSAVSAGSTSPVASGTYNNNINFSGFSGVSASGSWILYVTDNQGGDAGTLTDWSLDLSVVPEPTNVALGIFGGLLAVVMVVRSERVKSFFRRKNAV